MTISGSSNEQLIRQEKRRVRIAILIPGAVAIIALGGALLGTERGLSVEAARHFRSAFLSVSVLLFSGAFAYLALSAWRNGYILGGAGILERRRQPAAFLVQVTFHAFIATLMLLVFVVTVIARAGRYGV